MNTKQIKKNKKIVKMSCTAYIVYTFHKSLHHAIFGQFKAKHVLISNFSPPNKNLHFLSRKVFCPVTAMSAKNVIFFWTAPLSSCHNTRYIRDGNLEGIFSFFCCSFNTIFFFFSTLLLSFMI